jgi:hypothetical protein
MTPNKSEFENTGGRGWLWVAGALGAGVGMASWVYKRRRHTRWDDARARATRLVASAREEVRPWMGMAAGTAAAGTAAMIYTRRRRASQSSAARQFVSRAGRALRPWAGMAVNVAISLASTIYNQRTRKRATKAIRGAEKTAADLADRGRGVLRLLRKTSEETAKRYPRLRGA